MASSRSSQPPPQTPPSMLLLLVHFCRVMAGQFSRAPKRPANGSTVATSTFRRVDDGTRELPILPLAHLKEPPAVPQGSLPNRGIVPGELAGLERVCIPYVTLARASSSSQPHA